MIVPLEPEERLASPWLGVPGCTSAGEAFADEDRADDDHAKPADAADGAARVGRAHSRFGRLIDLGVQGTHIANQTAIYRLDPEARSRLTTVYMSAYFLGGALGSAGSALAYQHASWPGVTTTGLGLTLTGALLWTTEITTRRTLNDP